jgi:hypothetical protein
MQDEPLTVDECDEFAEALRERAASLPNGSEREKFLMRLNFRQRTKQAATVDRYSLKRWLCTEARHGRFMGLMVISIWYLPPTGSGSLV